jgi:hypothetical protein
MVLSWSPVLGCGTSKSVEQPLEKHIASQRLNMWLQLNFSLNFEPLPQEMFVHC